MPPALLEAPLVIDASPYAVADWRDVVRPRRLAGHAERGRTILGEAGLGKSSLVRRIAEDAASRGDWVTPQLRIPSGADPLKRLAAALLDQLGVQRFVIGGHSLVGEVAWATAHALPQRAQPLILVEAAGDSFEHESVPLAFRVAGTPGVNALMGHLLPPGMVEKSVRSVYGDPARVTPALVQRYSELARRAGNRHALATRMAQRNTGREQDIRDLKLPTLILWGQQDRLIPAANAQRFAADIKGSERVVFPGLGHVPHEEDPARTVAEVKRFLGM